MTPRHARFVQEYLIDRNGAAAAIRAGYSPRTARQIAYEILTRPDVAEAVGQGEAKLAAEAELSRAATLKGFQEAIEIARLRSDPSAMIAGWREIGKMSAITRRSESRFSSASTRGRSGTSSRG